MFDAVAVGDLAALLELLAPDAVEPLVLAQEQIVRVVLLNAREQLLHRPGVPRLSRSDPVVVTAVQPGPKVGKPFGHAVNPHLGLYPVVLGSLDHTLTVFVHSHEEMDVVTA